MTKTRKEYHEYLIGPIQRFDQMNDMFRRARYEPDWIQRVKAANGPDRVRDKPGYTHEYRALADAAWYVEKHFARGNWGSNHDGLYAWTGRASEEAGAYDGAKIDTSDPATVSQMVKRAANFYGASLVGICNLDERWLYSHVSNDVTKEHSELQLPKEYRYAVAMAIEMDYSLMRTSPTVGAAAGTGLGYSKMAFVAGLLAQFIRGLGYKAIPCGNDTALSIPIAIEAGLGELGRNGLLITEEFGPRVRLCKVFTDMPLIPDGPRFFGVEDFCQTCMICAQDCPSRAISFETKTTEALNRSNNPGVLKWPVNAEQCYKFWIANRRDCANCIRVCPFNKTQGWQHDLVRGLIKKVPQINPLIVRLDKLAGYDKQVAPEITWER